MSDDNADFIVIGAGIAGASVAAELSASGRVIVLEMEAQPGVHATGRSAALFSETYGNALIRALSRASRLYFQSVTTDEASLLRPRGVIYPATSQQRASLATALAGADIGRQAIELSGAEACSRCPALRPDRVVGAIYEPNASDVDVNGLLQGYLRRVRELGGKLCLASPVHTIKRRKELWTVTTGDLTFRAPIVVNAAGAWGDLVAEMAGVMPIGLQALRRTAVIVDPPTGANVNEWPAVIDIDEQFYFKPEGGKLLLSPADETPDLPCNAQPEEWDVALAIDRVTSIADIPVRHVRHRWAGLRTFTPDRSPVAGFDDRARGFFWLIGQGGYGVQTAPALARVAAALASGGTMPNDIASEGVLAEALSCLRLRRTVGNESARG